MNQAAILVLADGTVYKGYSIGALGQTTGELVFNTALTGYQEILSDPSYARQIVTLTTAHVGNTGCNSEDMESPYIWAAGLVVRNYSAQASNYRSQESLGDWLKKNNIVAIAGIDTRDLTLKLREHGAIGACISTDVEHLEKAQQLAQSFVGLQGNDLAFEVSRKKSELWSQGQGRWATHPVAEKYHIVAYDFGIKNSILQILYDKGCTITLVPANTAAHDVLNLKPDGIFLSNGPGDPKACVYAIEATKIFLESNIPLFGICLGFQILALACGASTYKMKFGHHGANHPVIETYGTRRVFISSQNHGFAVDEKTLNNDLIITHRSLFDNTLQGIKHVTKPAFGFQGHPEASPGPHDIRLIFDEFIKLLGDTPLN